MALLAIHNNESEYQCFAPDINQHHVINHISGEVMNESRNVLVESAQNCAWQYQALSELSVKDFDGIILQVVLVLQKTISIRTLTVPILKFSKTKNILIEAQEAEIPIGGCV